MVVTIIYINLPRPWPCLLEKYRHLQLTVPWFKSCLFNLVNGPFLLLPKISTFCYSEQKHFPLCEDDHNNSFHCKDG